MCTLAAYILIIHDTKKDGVVTTTPPYRDFRLLKRPHERSQIYLYQIFEFNNLTKSRILKDCLDKLTILFLSKANAFLSNRDYVMPDDVKEIAHDVLNHRIILNYEAEAEGIKPELIIKNILEKVEINS